MASGVKAEVTTSSTSARRGPQRVGAPTAPLRLGVVGLQMGLNHCQRIVARDDAKLVAVCDVKPTLQEKAESWGAHFYTDYRDLLAREELDAVVLSVPHDLHGVMAAAAAAAGCHILMEKPIAHSMADADRVIEAARAHDVQLLIGHMRRFGQAFRTGRRLVQNGTLGELIGAGVLDCSLTTEHYFEEAPWKGQRAHGGGPLLMVTIHDVDCLRFMCGNIVRVSTEAGHKARRQEVEDSAAISFVFENGAIGTLLVSNAVPNLPGHRFLLYGTKGSVDLSSFQLAHYPDPAELRKYPRVAGPPTVERIEPDPAGDMLTEQLDHFLRLVRGQDTVPICSGEEGKETLAVIIAMQESAERRAPVEVAEMLDRRV